MPDRNGEYYPAYCDMISVGRDAVFARSRNASRTHLLTPFEAELFAILKGCRSLREHLWVLEQSEIVDAAYIDSTRLEHMLNHWVDIEILRPRKLVDDTLEESGATPMSGQDAGYDTILACVTRDRPYALAEWLADFVRPDEEHFSRVVVVDDSLEDNSIRSNRQAVDKMPWNSVPVYYLSPEERCRRVGMIADRVSAAGVESAIVEFGLLGADAPRGFNTTGATRNVTLLIGAGKRIVSSDDDIRRRFAHFEPEEEQRVVIGEGAAERHQFFPSMDDVASALYSVEDALEALISILERPLSAFRNRVDHASITPKIACLFELNEPTTIAAATGCHGARQYAPALRTFINRRDHNDKTILDRVAFNAVRMHGLGAHQAEQLTFDIGDTFSTALCSLDATRELLPFFPWGRREDFCFRILQKLQYPSGLFASLPVTAYHDPLPKTPFLEREIGRYSVEFGTYNQFILSGFSQDLLREPGPRRVRELAGRFRNIGRMNQRSFREYLRHIQVAQLEMFQRMLHTELDLYNAEPVWWADELRSYISYMDREIADPESVVALELRSPERSVGDCLAIHQRFYAQWADLLDAWPIIWKASQTVNEDTDRDMTTS